MTTTTTQRAIGVEAIRLAQAVVEKYERYLRDARSRQDFDEATIYEANLRGAVEVRDMLKLRFGD